MTQVNAVIERDTQGVTSATESRVMNILLDCPWCDDGVDFAVDLAGEELICTACNTHLALAPDPVTTFELLYGPQQAA
jgi:hypothetical protein